MNTVLPPATTFQYDEKLKAYLPLDENGQVIKPAATVPVAPTQTFSDAAMSTAVAIQSAPVPDVITTTSLPAAASAPVEQKFSYRKPTGKLPPGYQAGKTCFSCIHFNPYYVEEGEGRGTGFCGKFDFPAHEHWLCDDQEDVTDQEWYEEASYNFMDAPSETLQKLSDIITDNPQIQIDLLEGTLKIKDEASAQIAVMFRENLADPTKKASLLSFATRFAPVAVAEAKAQDAIPAAQTTAADEVLFKLAMSFNPGADYKTVSSAYEALFQKKNNTLQGAYKLADATPASKPTEAKVPSVEKDAAPGESASEQTNSLSEAEPEIYSDPAFENTKKVAEARLKAQKENYSDQDVKELAVSILSRRKHKVQKLSQNTV